MEIRKNLEYSTTSTAAGRQYPKTRVGELLLKTRTEKGEKQREVSDRYGIAFPQGQIDVSGIETHAKLASEEVLLAVSEYSGVDLRIIEQMWELDAKERTDWINKGKSLASRKGASSKARARQGEETPKTALKVSQEDLAKQLAEKTRKEKQDEVYRRLIEVVPPPKGPEKLARWAALINELADLAVE